MHYNGYIPYFQKVSGHAEGFFFFFKTKIKLIEVKSYNNWGGNTLDVFSSILDIADKKISDLDKWTSNFIFRFKPPPNVHICSPKKWINYSWQQYL